MSDEGGEGPESAAEDAQEVIRVLMPSALGRLGIEFRGDVVTRIVIQPGRKEARRYQSLERVDLTDFLLEALGRLSELLAGLRISAELDFDLGPSATSGFAKRVLKETSRIAHGRTWTYKKLAEACGQPGAYHRVQAVLAQNPIPILIPCHRVVPSKGGVGSYVGGARKKEKLLQIERRSVA